MNIFKRLYNYLTDDVDLEYDDELYNDITGINMDELFTVVKFNEWFNEPDNGALYAHSGIFLRLDKLSDSQFFDYFESYDGIYDGEDFSYTEHYKKFTELKDNVRNDWSDKLNIISLK